jgi:DnaJ-class molecular chaperone
MSEYDAERFIAENVSDRRTNDDPVTETCQTCDGAGDLYAGQETCWRCGGSGTVEH